MKLFYLIFGLLLSAFVVAEEEKKPKPKPLDPVYYGVHPMALVNKGSNIYAVNICLLYTSPSPRDRQKSRMPSSA